MFRHTAHRALLLVMPAEVPLAQSWCSNSVRATHRLVSAMHRTMQAASLCFNHRTNLGGCMPQQLTCLFITCSLCVVNMLVTEAAQHPTNSPPRTPCGKQKPCACTQLLPLLVFPCDCAGAGGMLCSLYTQLYSKLAARHASWLIAWQKKHIIMGATHLRCTAPPICPQPVC